MPVSPLAILVVIALILAVASLIPTWPSHPLLAVATILLAVAMLVPAVKS